VLHFSVYTYIYAYTDTDVYVFMRVYMHIIYTEMDVHFQTMQGIVLYKLRSNFK
jgi:hypothetical protein